MKEKKKTLIITYNGIYGVPKTKFLETDHIIALQGDFLSGDLSREERLNILEKEADGLFDRVSKMYLYAAPYHLPNVIRILDKAKNEILHPHMLDAVVLITAT